MPAATPVPRGPGVLTLYTAADLLTGPGCPVCRYAGEAAGRYLEWFALEGHADVVTITRLCSSLGMCPRHTRGLMSQPGAASRLTAVYQYVMRAARDRLAGRATRLGACPGCEHDDGAARRALDTLLEGLAAGSAQDRYRELGGLCVPHLRAVSAHRDRHGLVGWLSQVMTAAAGSGPGCPGWLAGTDHDADMRAVLRRAARAGAPPGSQACVACLAAVRSEDDWLAHVLRASDRCRPDERLLLCGGHLGDAVALAGQRDAPSLLAWQAGCLAAGLARHRAPGGGLAGWVRARRRRGSGLDGCLVCQASEEAAQRAVDGLHGSLRASHPDPGGQASLCVRHLLGLSTRDPWAGQVTAAGAVERADTLIAELDLAFSKNTWAHRHEAGGPEMTAWRRAAAFVDGRVCCGCPPRDT
jgi:hypothetical protein